MRKWLLLFAALFAVAIVLWWRRDGAKVSYVNGLTLYSSLPGKEYIFERDCYIFKLTAHNTQYPLVGANAPDLPVSVKELPTEVSPKYLGTDRPGARLLDIARVGDRFKIISVRREERRSGTTITFEILFLNEAERKYPRLDAYWIMDHGPEQKGLAPRILEDFAAERVKK